MFQFFTSLRIHCAHSSNSLSSFSRDWDNLDIWIQFFYTFFHCLKIKIKKPIESILLINKTSTMENIKGYFKGLSSPSGTLKIMAFFMLQYQILLDIPNFLHSLKLQNQLPSVPSPNKPCLVISASR